MNRKLPQLNTTQLAPTRDYLQGIALTLSSLQRAYVPKNPHDWQYGLEVNLRGLVTQSFTVTGEELRASLDLVKAKVRLGSSNWLLTDYAPPEIFNNIQAWLVSRGAQVAIELPKFETQAWHFDPEVSEHYATALWWADKQFHKLKTSLSEGLTSPILLYPHHFDLSLVWFPHNDERQLALGFSTGDSVITEPYFYLTAYPEPKGFAKLILPGQAYWQSSGFSGAILPYDGLSRSQDPEKLFKSYAAVLVAARPLLG